MNKDTYYPIEIKICSKNGWFTPQEARSYYGRYARNGITIHHWALNGAQNHDNIVNYFMGQAAAGNKSVNYVVSDRKMTLMVSPDNVNWAQQSGNATEIGFEHQSDLGAEGYKKSGWLVDQLEERYGKSLVLHPHKFWYATACPAGIDVGRIRAEADKWKSGAYTPAPVPAPTPKPTPPVPPPPSPTVVLTYSKLPAPVKYIINKDTDLWNFNTATWAGFVSVKKFKKGEEFIVYGIADNHNVHAKYGMTQYSFGDADVTGKPKSTNGVNMNDLDLAPTPQPIPDPPPSSPGAPAPPPTLEERVSAIEKLLNVIKKILGIT